MINEKHNMAIEFLQLIFIQMIPNYFEKMVSVP